MSPARSGSQGSADKVVLRVLVSRALAKLQQSLSFVAGVVKS